MATYRELADAMIEFEGAMNPRSVNMAIYRTYGMWNAGHLTWAHQKGAVPVEVNGRLWAAWPTYEESVEGLIRQIKLDASRGMTLSEFVEKYAPREENPTDRYIEFVSRRTGIAPDQRLQDALLPLDYGPDGGDVWAGNDQPQYTWSVDVWARADDGQPGSAWGSESADYDRSILPIVVAGILVGVAASS